MKKVFLVIEIISAIVAFTSCEKQCVTIVNQSGYNTSVNVTDSKKTKILFETLDKAKFREGIVTINNDKKYVVQCGQYNLDNSPLYEWHLYEGYASRKEIKPIN